MTRFRNRLACGSLLVVLCVAAVPAQSPSVSAPPTRPGQLPPPDYETLRGLASQLGGSPGGQIDPKLLEQAREFIKNNPGFTQTPQFQQMLQQYQNNPEFVNKLKNTGGGMSQQDLEQFKNMFPPTGQGAGGGTPPTPPQIPRPDPTGGTQGTNPNPMPGTQPGGQPTETTAQATPLERPPNLQQQYGPNSSPQNGSQGNAVQDLAQKNQDFGQMVGMWEANFGSLDNTPALKQSLLDMFSGDGQNPLGGMGGGGLNGLGNGAGANGGPGSNWMNGNANNSGSGFGNWLKNMSSNGGPSWWKNMTSGGSGKSWWNGGGGNTNWTPPSPPGGGFSGAGLGGMGGGIGGLGTAGTVVLLVLAAAAVAFLLLRYWPQIAAMRDKPKPIAGLGEWPLDPRDVKDRDTLVRAFEYLSVLVCGGGAVVWNHVTIAEAMRANVPGAAPFADDLARLYALARYTPTGEPISPADIAAARGYLCRLAGVPA